jgi:hypothetical protein
MVSSGNGYVRITINTGDYFVYKNIDDIKPEYYDKIMYLYCPNLNLTSLPQYYPNLEELYCIGNHLTEIPQYPKLKKLYCNNNNITHLNEYPFLVELNCNKNSISQINDYPLLDSLICSRNKIVSIGKCPLLTVLDCRFNNITNLNISEYPLLCNLQCQVNKITQIQDHYNLIHLNCMYNEIITLGDLPRLNVLLASNNLINEINDYQNIISIDISNNHIRRLPNIMHWNNLMTFNYNGNEIDYIPPNIIRKLTLLTERRRQAQLNIYNDSQNVHNHTIQESISQSIQNIISDKPDISFEVMISEILGTHILTNDVKNMLIDFSNSTDIHMAIGITFKELLLSVWSVIRKHIHKDNILEVLNIEMNDSICKCFTGRISRLINSLNGFDERVNITIPDNIQIGNLIVIIGQKLENNGDYTVEKHKQMVYQELVERGFTDDIINIWIEHIE